MIECDDTISRIDLGSNTIVYTKKALEPKENTNTLNPQYNTTKIDSNVNKNLPHQEDQSVTQILLSDQQEQNFIEITGDISEAINEIQYYSK
ncbi:MAG: hypothetical protein DGJ47_000693 [Rickettsiaceae bacterium]